MRKNKSNTYVTNDDIYRTVWRNEVWITNNHVTLSPCNCGRGHWLLPSAYGINLKMWWNGSLLCSFTLCPLSRLSLGSSFSIGPEGKSVPKSQRVHRCSKLLWKMNYTIHMMHLAFWKFQVSIYLVRVCSME